jgi:hypothetical protein
MSLDIYDANSTLLQLKTTDNAGEHTPHHIIDGVTTVAFGENEHAHVVAESFFLGVAETNTHLGSISRNVFIMGSRSLGWENTSSLGDACDYLNTSQSRLNTCTAVDDLNIVSSSGNDTNTAGTGARTVQIVYLDAAGLETSVTVALNGSTPVNLGTGFTAIQWAEVASVGSSTVSEGIITIYKGATNNVANTLERIAAGGNRSLSGRYKIPSDCNGYLHNFSASAIGNTMDVRLRADVLTYGNVLSEGVFHFLDRAFLASGVEDTYPHEYIKLPPGATVKISAIPGAAAAGNKLDCDFSILLIDGVA